MRRRTLIRVLALLVSLSLVACGGEKQDGENGSVGNGEPEVAQIPNLPPPKETDTTSARKIAKRPEPNVKVPSGPPPKELLVGDLITGRGAPIETGDRVGVRWVAYSYETGSLVENSWTLTRDTLLGAGEVNEGWERGLPGMKVGGVRELIVPSKLTRFGDEPLVYVVSLLWSK